MLSPVAGGRRGSASGKAFAAPFADVDLSAQLKAGGGGAGGAGGGVLFVSSATSGGGKRLPTIDERSACTPQALTYYNNFGRPLRGLRFPRTKSLTPSMFHSALGGVGGEGGEDDEEEREASTDALGEESVAVHPVTEEKEQTDTQSFPGSMMDGSTFSMSSRSLSSDSSSHTFQSNSSSVTTEIKTDGAGRSRKGYRPMDQKRPTKVELEEKLKRLEASFSNSPTVHKPQQAMEDCSSSETDSTSSEGNMRHHHLKKQSSSDLLYSPLNSSSNAETYSSHIENTGLRTASQRRAFFSD